MGGKSEREPKIWESGYLDFICEVANPCVLCPVMKVWRQRYRGADLTEALIPAGDTVRMLSPCQGVGKEHLIRCDPLDLHDKKEHLWAGLFAHSHFPTAVRR